MAKYTNNNNFSAIFRLGIEPIIPITPGQKSPAITDWFGRGPAGRDDVMAWDGWSGHGVSVLNKYFPAVDIDVTDPGLVDAIEIVVVDALGLSPRRTGRPPKAALVYEIDVPGSWKSRTVHFELADGTKHQVEFRGQGHLLLLGQHVTTGDAYHWPGQDIGHAWYQNGAAKHPFPKITAQNLQDCLKEVEKFLSGNDQILNVSVTGSDLGAGDVPGGQINPSRYDQDFQQVLSTLIKELPAEPDRDEWVRIGTAIKASLGEDGYEAWTAWSDKYAEGQQEADRVWNSIDPRGDIGPGTILRKFHQEVGRQLTDDETLIIDRNLHPSPQDEFDVIWDTETISAADLGLDVTQGKTLQQGLGKTKWLSDQDITALPGTDEAWLIDGLVPAEGVCFLYGAPGTGKSFIMLGMGMCVTLGQQWMGRDVDRPGKVFYVVSEGGLVMLADRMKAWVLENGGVQNGDFYSMLTSLDLRNDFKHADALIRDIKAICGDEKPAMVVVDTLNRNSAGANENSSEDMGKVLEKLTYIQQVLKCAVFTVHHSGKDQTKGLRGHSSLDGASDLTLETVRDKPSMYGTLVVRKSRGSEDGTEIGWQMKLRWVRDDGKGRPVDVPVIVPDASMRASNTVSGVVLSAAGKQVWDVLKKLRGLFGDGAEILKTTIVKEVLMSTLGAEKVDNKVDMQSSTARQVRRGLKDLENRGFVEVGHRGVRVLEEEVDKVDKPF